MNGHKAEKVCLFIPYAILQQTKALSSFEVTNGMIYEKFVKREAFTMLDLEGSYRVQILTELFMQSLPQVIIQLLNNNGLKRWDAFCVFCFMISCAMLAKNTIILLVFLI